MYAPPRARGDQRLWASAPRTADAEVMTQRTEAAVRGVATDQIAWFEDLSKADVPRVGGKGANLGELSRAELPVPPGFVVTADAYLQAMEAGGVRAALQELVANLDVD